MHGNGLSGWQLRGLPPGCPPTLVKIFGNKVWHGNSGVDTINKVATIITQNGGTVNRAAVCNWANDSWCRRDPRRCEGYARGRRSNKLDPPVILWARSFWESWLRGLSKDDVNFNAFNASMADQATRRIGHPRTGCFRCARHWEAWMDSSPAGNHASLRDARRWLWKAINHTHETREKESWEKVCKRWGWEI